MAIFNSKTYIGSLSWYLLPIWLVNFFFKYYLSWEIIITAFPVFQVCRDYQINFMGKNVCKMFIHLLLILPVTSYLKIIVLTVLFSTFMIFVLLVLIIWKYWFCARKGFLKLLSYHKTRAESTQACYSMIKPYYTPKAPIFH